MKKTMIAAIVFLCVLLLAISSFALTPQQVIDLKKAGVSDQTIQLMIKQEEDAKASQATKATKEAAGKAEQDPYATMGTRDVTDKDGNTVTIYTTGKSGVSAADEEEAKKVEKAWEILKGMTIKKQ